MEACYLGKEQGIQNCENCWAKLACVKYNDSVGKRK